MLNFIRQILFNEEPARRPAKEVNRVDSEEAFSRSTWRLATAVALRTNSMAVTIEEMEDLR